MLLAIEGFEGGNTSDATLRTYCTRRGYTHHANINYTTGRFDSVALSLFADRYCTIPFSAKQTVIIGFAFKFTNFNLDNVALLALRDSSINHIILQLKTNGELRVMRSTTQLGVTSGLGLSANIWYYIELKVTIDDSAGVVELRVDGSEKLNLTSQDTREGGNATVDNLYLIGDDPSINIFIYDDVYIIDTTGGINDDFLGNSKIMTLKPNGDGATTEFTPKDGPGNYTEVDDGATVDDDSSYVEESITGKKDLYDYENLSGEGAIRGVSVLTEARETDAVDYTLKTVVKSSTTESDDTAQALSSSYTIIERILDEDPHTSAAWVEANLNAAQFGMKIG